MVAKGLVRCVVFGSLEAAALLFLASCSLSEAGAPAGAGPGPEPEVVQKDGTAALPTDSAVTDVIDEGDWPADFGDPCNENGDCSSGFCLFTRDGLRCSSACIENCPPGFACQPIPQSGTDIQFACAQAHISLCRPCDTAADCDVEGINDLARCEPLGEDGSFCATTCVEGGCPEGFSCLPVSEAPGAADAGRVCRPDDGECVCFGAAIAANASTTCSATSEHGTCQGTRRCGNTGLTACDALEPAAETCNGLDDDCDGTTDEGESDCDQDGIADCVDTDLDGDGVPESSEDPDVAFECEGGQKNGCLDNCPDCVPNPDQTDKNGNGVGDQCDPWFIDDDGDGWSEDDGDCDDQDKTVGLCAQYHADHDSDGFPDETDMQCLCAPEGFYTVEKQPGGMVYDCDDWNGDIHPDATEVCALPGEEPVDENCDGIFDPVGSTGCQKYYLDEDIDGYGKPGKSKCLCGPSEPYVAAEGADCDDSKAAVHPDAEELCNLLDDDCDGMTDDAPGVSEACQFQCKSAGYCPPECAVSLACVGECGVGKQVCEAGVLAACFDPAANVCVDPADDCEPFVTCDPCPTLPVDTCNGLDDDCDGETDEDHQAEPTTCGTGACAATGLAGCVGGQVVDTCVPGTPAETDSTCDGIDDDCDEHTDEEYTPISSGCGIGPCAAVGTTTCVDGKVVEDCEPLPGGIDDDCDGIDDDCDGLTDEHFVPSPTSCGIGPCSNAGFGECLQGKVVDSCVPGQPAANDSTCDGLDDDCDGLTDEDHTPSTSTCGLGNCAATGTTVCEDGVVLDDCVPGPKGIDDDCDGGDDDCDGLTDEHYVATATTCGVGSCTAAGTTTCEAGNTIDSCVPGPKGVDDDCDGIDDDCDGETDEHYVSSPTGCGVGACVSTGSVECVGGKPTDTCVPGQKTPDTTCDGKDDDCDGATDEHFSAKTITCGKGACERTGILDCSAGQEIESCNPGPQLGPDTTCDGIDDDCDGATDEHVAPKPTTCGVGACKANGQQVCEGGTWVGTCQPGPEAPDTDCDGVDDDCDGSKDEHYASKTTECGVGGCKQTGSTTCSAGVEVDSCEPGSSTPDNNCNGVDDDCDGATDEHWVAKKTTCGSGICAAEGLLGCENGATVDTCQPSSGTELDETCDGVDDDCDGNPDDDFSGATTTCGVGACKTAGKEQCVSGKVEDTCSEGTPAAGDTTCDGVDDDCDDATDEDYQPEPLSCGIGACVAAGQTQCVGGQVIENCDPLQSAPTDGTCDGVDDNCNGQEDEGYQLQTTECGVGECAATGSTSCVGGEVIDSCKPKTPAANDPTCDGKDDDCDGTVDEDCCGSEGLPCCAFGCNAPLSCSGDVCECEPLAAPGCSDGDVWQLDCHSVPLQKLHECEGCGCSAGSCDVVPHASTACQDSAVWWIDCLGDLSEEKESCGSCACENATCQSDAQAGSTCSQGDLWWTDCHGNTTSLKEDCADCGCASGQCGYQDQVATTCQGGDVWWSDCKGQTTSQKQDCGTCGCVNGQCGYQDQVGTTCQGGDVWWADCSGDTTSQKQDCGTCGCSSGQCGYQDQVGETCKNGDVWWTDCNGATTSQKTECYDCGCSNGQCGYQNQVGTTCQNNDVWWTDCKGQTTTQKQGCDSCGCSNGQCGYQNYVGETCQSGDVWWTDCHGDATSQKTECDSCGCSGGQCGSNSQYSSACNGNDVWYKDCHGSFSYEKEDCVSCGCSNGTCLTNNQYSEGCHYNDVWWKDCKGSWSSQKEDCVNCGCSNGSCLSDNQYAKGCRYGNVWWKTCQNTWYTEEEDCGDCPCSGGACDIPSYYWSPTSDSETDTTGKQYSQTISASIKVEVAQDGSTEGLKWRVCKIGGTFSQNVYFKITDGASAKAYRTITMLPTQGKNCSSWLTLLNDTGYSTGQQFGGHWTVVSPYTSASEWNPNCSPDANAGGTCWNGVSITLTRTCK